MSIVDSRCTTPTDLESAFRRIVDYCRSFAIDLNTTKSVLINYNGTPLAYNDVPLPRIESSKYLGVAIGNHGLRLFAHATGQHAFAQTLFHRLSSSDAAAYWDPPTRRLLYLSLIRPKTESATTLASTLTHANTPHKHSPFVFRPLCGCVNQPNIFLGAK